MTGIGGATPLRIAVLQGDPGDAPYAEHDPPADPGRYLPGHEWASLRLTKASAVRELIALERAGVDVVVNLCDGAWDEAAPGIEVAEALERLGLAYTGADPRTYDPSRLAMKLACHSAGVATPAFATARSGAEAPRIVRDLDVPLIVKHPHGYSSIGMTRDSLVTDAASLAREIDRLAAAYGSALVESFVEGREFTVLVAEAAESGGEPRTFTPIEVRFPAGETFKHFDLKWVDWEALGWVPVADPALESGLRAAASAIFAALGTVGYARVDFRLAADGTLHALELNPNCGVFGPDDAYASADFCLAADPAGHRGFLEHVIACALRRRDEGRAPVEVRAAGAGGFGLFATRALDPGTVVQRGEEQPVRLVSRLHVRRAWSPVQRRWFHQYAWPLTDGVHAIWSDDPEQWQPVNHSCDPSTWLVGLDLVTRRAVAEGEELTMDYATFTGPDLEPFDCACSTAACRGRVGPADHLDPVLAARYGEHVSDYVRRARVEPFTLRPCGLGTELVATRPFTAGERLAALGWAAPASAPSRWTVQRGAALHAEPLPAPLRYANHGCDPNIRFDVDGDAITALRDIAPGDPLCFFYPSTEWDMAEPFDCACGAARCVGRVAGAAHLDPAVLGGYAVSAFVAGAAAGVV